LGFSGGTQTSACRKKLVPQLGDIGIVDTLIRNRFDLLKPSF